MKARTRSDEREELSRQKGCEAGQPGQLADGDLTQLYASYGPALRAHCAHLLGDRASAEDATHEVFLRLGRGRLPPHDEMRPWLFRIASNHCLNELRRRSIRARTLPLAQLPSDQQDAMAARNDARRLLEQLAPRARAVAVLTYVDGMLQHEVASTLGVSRRTVVNHLKQVRASVVTSSATARASAAQVR